MCKQHRGRALWILAAAALAFADAAGAETGWYLGASWGASSFHHDLEDFSDGSLAGGAVDDTDSGWKVFAGYGWSPRWAVEVGYSLLNNDYDGETTFFGGLSDGSGHGED